MNLLNDYQLAVMLNELYQDNGGNVKWDHYDPGDTDSICWAYQRVDGVSYVALRGSKTAKDWERDFMAVANPFTHDQLGPVHLGFLIGMSELWVEIKATVPGPYVIMGHSLGAARADILSGFMVISGVDPLYIFCCGEPKPGFQKLAVIMGRIPKNSYRNTYGPAHDIVTDVPLGAPPVLFVHSKALIDITAKPSLDDVLKLSVFAEHHMGLYVQALQAKNVQ